MRFRLALVQAAEKTLDLQYYTIHNDTSANLLLEAILRAAARGVRVRFLIDDTSMKAVGKSLSVLNNNARIEIRVFNPLITRSQSYKERVISLLTGLSKANKRMHNKALIVDNQMAIIGGRNLGDEYFDAHADANFKDADILMAGPITARLSQSFDSYWNGDNAFPIHALVKPVRERRATTRLRRELKAHWDEKLATAEGKAMLESRLSERLKEAEVTLVWAKAELAADDAGKVDEATEATTSTPMSRLHALLADAKREFIIVSPYFVPQAKGVAWLKELTKRGIRVTVLTNSLASTDVVAVHTGYKRYRQPLVENGIALYELKPFHGKRPRQRLIGLSSPAHASLHAKLYMIDRNTLMIGSFNFDPRSISLNTELALVVHSADITLQVAKMFEEVVSPKLSYHVAMDQATHKLVWFTQHKGKHLRFWRDPKPGVWRFIEEKLMSLLPVENQL